jgi:hypothetical protein
MTNEPAVFTMLHQYDEAKAHLRAIEEELNKECALYGRNVLGLWGFSPNHLRQRLYALGLTKKEQTND